MKTEDFITATYKAKNTFTEIMANYPGLKAYLVLSSLLGQCELTNDPVQILEEFPAMISESEFKDKGSKLLETLQGLRVELKDVYGGDIKSEIQKKIEKTSQLLNADLQKIEFIEGTFIEIRFKTPLLDLIFKMQKDPLVSQLHTPQTQASIRIVLGTLIELATRVEKLRANKPG